MSTRGRSRSSFAPRSAPRGRVSLLGTTALATSLTLFIGGAPALAGQKSVLPSGGSFVGGAGSISLSGSSLTINQSTARGVIDWNRFSISANGSVQFNNGAGATLNRVTGGGGASFLLGTLAASGSVYLLNPSGVLIGKSGSIQTGGSFVASTLDVSNDAFMAGGALTLSGSSTAAVRNLGTITSQSGDVLLVARTVTNSGSIAAPNGTAGLAAGQQVLLQDAGGDQRIFIEAPGGDVTNTGRIAAAAAELKSAGGNVYALAGNNGGQISATGTAVINGHVWLTASGGGTVAVAGTVTAQNADGSGGAVDVRGQNIAVAAGSTMDASAGASGNGGRVSVIATNSTMVAGTIRARGGAQSGDGGEIETSGEQLTVTAAARIDAGAPHGAAGTWLLDPNDVVIDDSGNTGTVSASGTASTLSGGTNVTISTTTSGVAGTGELDVNAGISWTGSATLRLEAEDSIAVNAAITGTGGALNLTAGLATATGSITLNAPVSVGTFAATAGSSGTINLDYSSGIGNSAVTTSGGGQTYNSPITLGAETVLSDNDFGTISLVGQASGGSNSLLLDANNVTLSGFTTTAIGGLGLSGGLTLDTGLYTIGDGSTTYTFPSTPTTINGTLTLGQPTVFPGAISLGNGAAVLSNGPNGNIAFSGVIDPSSQGSALTVNAGTGGTATFGGDIGSAPLARLSMLEVDAGTITFSGRVSPRCCSNPPAR